jgi:hypothetical protein
MTNLEQVVNKDSRCLYKYCMIHPPMAVYIIQFIKHFAIVLYTYFLRVIRFLLENLCTFFSILFVVMKIIHFKKNREGYYGEK